MKSKVKKIIKYILFILHIDITKNQQYDRQTLKIMNRILESNSNCIDIGCHKGEILEVMLKIAGKGKHNAFEPIPYLYEKLLIKFKNKSVNISPIALSDSKGTTTFNLVKNAPAYSGLKQRKYDIKNPDIEIITVETDRLDNIITNDQNIHFIKIDVEGAEFAVLQGAVQTIMRCKPVIVFEFGTGASDFYNTTPELVYEFINDKCRLKISTLKRWLNGADSLDLVKLKEHFIKGDEYYFIAYP
jgi:FkbM family methyltransferase